MALKENLDELLDDLPEERLRQIVDFARFLSWEEERQAWQQFGMSQLAKAYGPDEPEYTEADLKPEVKP